MNQQQIGAFIAARRKAFGLTQEQLGERLGVTNKTVSRWETGRYMPDLDKLQELASLLGVSVDDLLAAEALQQEEPSKPAVFSLEEKIRYYRRKWRLEHRGLVAFCGLAWAAGLIAAFLSGYLLLTVAVIQAGLGLYAWLRNRMMSYVERRAFDDPRESINHGKAR